METNKYMRIMSYNCLMKKNLLYLINTLYCLSDEIPTFCYSCHCCLHTVTFKQPLSSLNCSIYHSL